MFISVRRLRPRELESALRLVQRTFLQFEAPGYGPEGAETFRRDILENTAFHMACRSGENRMWGAFDGRKLAGVIVMCTPSHITLAFVDSAYHRQGVGTALFRRLEEEIRGDFSLNPPGITAITVNSSPYGEPFYHSLGFRDVGPRQRRDGIIFTPMQYDLK